jgi:RimJ/RimL family protein N-acetyltransferase
LTDDEVKYLPCCCIAPCPDPARPCVSSRYEITDKLTAIKHAHGRGHATEAASAVLDAAIATGRTRLWSTVGTWNTPSFRVLEKLGFERQHVSKDDRGEFVWLTRPLP